MMELTYTPESVHRALKASLLGHTVAATQPELDAELPDVGMPDEYDDDDEGQDEDE